MKTGNVTVIGGGPAGLMAAEVLIQGGAQVDVYDAMPSVGRKFLRAGTGGLNITHSEPFEKFVSRYGTRRPQIEPLLRVFGPVELQAWVQELGFKTFVGTSGRVFPVGMKASPLLRAWLKRLQDNGVKFYLRYKWVGWDKERSVSSLPPPEKNPSRLMQSSWHSAVEVGVDSARMAHGSIFLIRQGFEWKR